MNCLTGSDKRVYSLDDYVSGDAPYAELYALRGDPFAFQRRQSELASESKRVGYIGFVKTYKAFESTRKGAMMASTNVTEFSGQPMELDCGAWHADDLGVTLGTAQGEIVACVHPIEPVKRLVNVDTGIEKLELAYRKGKAWRYLIEDKPTLSSANKIVELSGNGIAVTSETAKHLVKYLHDVENFNYDIIPEIPSVGRLGHIPGYGFSPYVDNLTFDGDLSCKSAFNSVRPHGNYSDWLATIKAMRSYSIAAKIVIASSFASVLAEPFNVLPFFVHLWGTASGTGKTVALMAAASVWADPTMGRYVKTFDSTAVGLEQYAGFLNSLPVIIDEYQLSRDSSGKSKFSVYKLAEGVGRLRGKRTGGNDLTVTWANCILTSGETPLTQENSGAGALNRVIDIECNNEDNKIVENGRAIVGVLKSHYGHAGKMFIERLTADVIEESKKAYSKIAEELSETDAAEKQALSAALIVTADRLIAEWFFHDAPITPSDMVDFLQTNASIDVNERAYAYLCDWVSINTNRFSANSQEVYGVIEKGWAYINRGIFNRTLTEEGYSVKGFLGWAKRKGRIDTRGRAFTKPKKINDSPVECVVLMLPVDAEELPF